MGGSSKVQSKVFPFSFFKSTHNGRAKLYFYIKWLIRFVKNSHIGEYFIGLAKNN